MIGYYDYSVLLTYLSAISAGLGIIVSLQGTGHPYWGTFFLMFCGLCDAFDGRVARTKKDRTEAHKKFGIQIDSLSDIVAFGVLPACIGNAMIRICPSLPEIPRVNRDNRIEFPLAVVLFAIILLYILAVLIRLAYFNVEEEERQNTEKGGRKYYTGVPVTSSALVFPTVLLIQYLVPADMTLLYFLIMFILGFSFLSKIKVPKPGLRGILIMIGIGVVEFIALAFAWNLRG